MSSNSNNSNSQNIADNIDISQVEEASTKQDESSNQTTNVLCSKSDQLQTSATMAEMSSRCSTDFTMGTKQSDDTPPIDQSLMITSNEKNVLNNNTTEESVLQQNAVNCNDDIFNNTKTESITNIATKDSSSFEAVQQTSYCQETPTSCFSIEKFNNQEETHTNLFEAEQQASSKQTNQSAVGSIWSILNNGPHQASKKTTEKTLESTDFRLVDNSSALSRGKTTVANLFGHFKRYPEIQLNIVDATTKPKQDQHHKNDDNSKCRDSTNTNHQELAAHNCTKESNTNQAAIKARQYQVELPLVSPPSNAMHQQTTIDLVSISNSLNRFNVRYLGSSILHKNFTLPMLEWIAKDIKRQTVKGAKTTSQRQITIPARDIVLEIQSFQLRGSSCKDGHCIFVHPMQHVSKYAQLQHDPNCFSYLIRDYKDSPYTCHVFQAKNVKKVHDIFTAVREATTRSRTENSIPKISSTTDNQNGSCSPLIVGARQPQLVALSQKPLDDHFNRKDTHYSTDAKLNDLPKQFENSYQFEVMFVKKVKLQCRRVPSTFVDDAMETLKSFEVLKNTETKTSGLGKRIISASVDERQEYDENCSSPTPSGVSTKNINLSQDSGNNVILNKESSKESSRFRTDDYAEHRDNLKPFDDHFGSTCSLNIVPGCSNQIEKSNIADDQKLSIAKAPLTQTLSMDSGSKQMLLDKLKDHSEENVNRGIQKSSSQSFFASTLSGGYNNDFSPYNTITSIDVNNQIAALPVMSSSVSLDHETRQKLARQIREKLMETASNLSSSRNSINKSNEKVSTHDNSDYNLPSNSRSSSGDLTSLHNIIDPSIDKIYDLKSPEQPHNKSNMSNFDLFRRASTRQVVKNRTMLLLIGKDELCTISTDHHQVLFNKSFNCIVHCLQGTKNNDHFGLICRDSGKINPNTESYAGFIFKCQSDKVVREVMAAMKQVLHNSHHNFHSYNSPYNPLNSSSFQYKIPSTTQQMSPGMNIHLSQSSAMEATNRFIKPNNLEQKQTINEININNSKTIHLRNRPNPIRSMFCDDCPLHWYHRLCCDLESMPPEASKTIILRRLDTSFSELEQDELLSKFSEFKIETVNEHNDIFMSLLRHLCEKKQSRHNQSQSHILALANYNSSVSDSQHNESSPSAMGNLIKAKKSISASIENILKRRSSLVDDTDDQSNNTMHKSNSFVHDNNCPDNKASSSHICAKNSTKSGDTLESPPKKQPNFGLGNISKINDDYNPLAGLFRRRSSTFGSNSIDLNCMNHDDKPLSSSCVPTSDHKNCLRHASSETRLSPSNQSADGINKSQDNIASKPPVSPIISKYASFIHPLKNQSQSHDTGKHDSSSSSVLTSTFWKKSIYEKIRSTVTTEDTVNISSCDIDRRLPTSTSFVGLSENKTTEIKQSQDKASKKPRSSEEIRYLWRKAIDEQITLIKMDKQNKILQVQMEEKSGHEIKLNYKDYNVSKLTNAQWDKLLMQDPTFKVDFSTVSALIQKGVSHNKRGEVWMFLMNQYQLRHGTAFHTSDREYAGDANQPYRNLLTQLSLQQHEIFVDLGRTFPNHPYYSQFLGTGQLSLFNLLKAYSLLDPQVGYCQGLSFVAGILLLHVNSEDEAFELMRHLLFNYGLRKQYLPSMNALQLQLYQLTRLLRDFEYDIFRHFDNHDISPSLYAAPWFLTLFASQFPMSFTARLFDLLFLHGIEAIFRISISLLSYHRDSIIRCPTLESTMKYIKTSLTSIKNEDMVEIFDKSSKMNLRNNLIDYEIEYTFYCAHDCSNRFNLSKASNGEASAKSIEPSNSNDEDETLKNTSTEPSSVVATAAAAILQQLILNDYNQTISISTQSSL